MPSFCRATATQKPPTIVVPSLTIPAGSALRFPAIADGTIVNGVRYFFVDDPEYFDRAELYGEKGRDYPDNGARFGEFSRAAIEIAKNVWPADVIHCHDWQTALVPVLLKTVYEPDPLLRGVPVVFTIHNMGYHGLFPRTELAELGLPETLFRMDALEFYGKVNFLKGGLIYLGLPHHREPKVRRRNSNRRLRLRSRWSSSKSRRKIERNSEWCRLFHLESGNRYADRRALFGKGSHGQESMQAGSARSIQARLRKIFTAQ